MQELKTVLGRDEALRLLLSHGRALGCEVGVYGPDGEPIAGSARMPVLIPSRANGRLHFGDFAGSLSTRPVRAYDRCVGHVVAWQDTPESGPCETAARDGADLLAALCAREYELNDLSREILDAYEELNLFYDLSATLAGAPDLDSVAAGMLKMAERVVRAEGCWVLAPHPSGGLRVVAERGMPFERGTILAMDEIRGSVLEGNGPELIEDLARVPSTRLGVLGGAVHRSLISVALRVPGHDDRAALGLLQLCDKLPADGRSTVGFRASDLKLAHAIAGQAAALVENSRLIGYERELEIARTIQRRLLPSRGVQIPALDVAGQCVQASNVGGDYYDHIVLQDGRLALLLADVSGHNLAAALIQTAARSTFRAAALTGASPIDVLDRSNRTLFDDLSNSELFLTAWFGVVNPTNGELTFGDAGHNPALLYRAASREIESLSAGGVPIGVLRDGGYSEATTQLLPGDVLLVYTDGLTEAVGSSGLREEFGDVRLRHCLATASGGCASEIVDAVMKAVTEFAGGGPAGDDRTLLVLKLRAPVASR